MYNCNKVSPHASVSFIVWKWNWTRYFHTLKYHPVLACNILLKQRYNIIAVTLSSNSCVEENMYIYERYIEPRNVLWTVYSYVISQFLNNQENIKHNKTGQKLELKIILFLFYFRPLEMQKVSFPISLQH